MARREPANYRVQFGVGMDSLHRDFADATCAARSYKRMAKLFGGLSVGDDEDLCTVRLWNLKTDRVLLTTEHATTELDAAIADALLEP